MAEALPQHEKKSLPIGGAEILDDRPDMIMNGVLDGHPGRRRGGGLSHQARHQASSTHRAPALGPDHTSGHPVQPQAILGRIRDFVESSPGDGKDLGDNVTDLVR
jgi:hypothetical protein